MGRVVGGFARAVFVLGIVGTAAWVAPQLIARTAATPAPRPTTVVTVAPALATRIATVDKAMAQARQSGAAVAVTLRVTDADLTTAAQPYFPQTYSGITVSDPLVRLGSGRLTFSAKASSLVLSGPLVATATPFASGGKLALRVDSAAIAGLGLPDTTKALIQQQLQAALDASMSPKLQVASVTVGQGEATIGGAALP
jgi:hypothetical protein